MVLETFSLGLIIPIVSLLTQEDYKSRIPLGDSVLADVSQRQVLVLAMAFIVLVHVTKSAFVYFSALNQRRFINSVAARISHDTFKRYLRQPYQFHLERNSAHLISNVDNAKALITGGLDPILVVLTDGLVVVGLLALLLFVEPLGTLCIVALFSISTLSFRMLTRRRIVHWGVARKLHFQQVLQHLQQGLAGAKEIKVLGREKQFLIDHERHLHASMDVDRRFTMIQLLPRLWLETLTVVGLAALVSVIVGSGASLSSILPLLGLFAATAFRVMPSISRILASFQTISYTLPIAKTVFEDFQLVEEVDQFGQTPSAFEKSIEFVGVFFRYEITGRPALRDVNFRIERGEAVGVIGASGAGKSTLVDVLLGLLAPSAGEVCVDEVNIANHRRWWQDQIGYVPQTIYLTDDTLLSNVAFGLPAEDIDRAAVERAISASQLDEFVNSLPEGLNTVVGERGVRLSGGQRQRIGIARALYHDPSVLVLDEATSALDSETESGVMEAVRGLLGKKTVIIVAHRTTTVSYCNRILRFEDGSLVAQGSPSEILV